MGRGTSKAGIGARGGGMSKGVTSVSVGNTTIDLTGIPLVYGDKDAGVTGKARTVVEAWEDKRGKNKIEYNISVDQDGNIVGDEVKGGRNSVRVPLYALGADMIHTHIHPRAGENEQGVLGGTFSTGDLFNFANYDVATYRAKAKEGTYSITKTKDFNKNQGFKAYVKDIHDKHDNILSETMKNARSKLKNKTDTYEQYSKEFDKAFNTFLVSMHNDLLEGQKKYGYTYTLERR